SSALAHSIARAVIAQLATWVGPADWQLVVVSSDARAWRWVDWLPHGALDGAAMIDVDGARVEGLGDALDAVDPTRTTLLVTDEPRLFTARTGALRRFLGASGAAAIVVVDTEATVPAMCQRVLTVGSTGSATWTGDVPDEDDAVAIEFAGISLDTADEIARSLACLVDPEDDGGSGGGVPGTVSFGELLAMSDASPEAIARRWRDGGPDPAPAAPLGWSVDGRVDIDLVRDGPHGLIAGTTGAGKSELLRTLVLSLAACVGPQHLNFVLVDYKGGSTFDACTALPHTVGLVTDLDDGLAERALVSLDAELHRRERMLRSVGAADLTDYRARRDGSGAPLDPIARLVVVIDEFAALAKELPDFLSALVGIAQRGRSLGVHLLLATQRPAGVVNDDIRANTNLRLALRLHDRPDAMDVVGDELPSKFPRGVPGRAALRLGPDELVVFQAARCTGPSVGGDTCGMIVERPASPSQGARRHRSWSGQSFDREWSELEVTAEAIVAAAAIDGVDAPHRPWVEPLPFPLHWADGVERDGVDATGARDRMEGGVEGGDVSWSAAIGMVDDPGRQRRVPLVWKPGDGSLALIGSIGSGTTRTMISLAAARCRSTAPDRLHLYVIDARGDDALGALSSLAHCGGVVRVVEDERLHRLLRRVVDLIDERMTADTDDGPDVVVMIDGYASVRTALGAVERQATFDLLQRVVNDGPATRVEVVIADDATSAMTMAPVANRWFFHLDDPSAARGLGLRATPVAGGRPGRCRILACGREAQVAQGAAGLAALPGHGDVDGGPDPLVVLPDRVGAEALVASHHAAPGRGVVVLPVGLSSAELGVATLEVAPGDHVLIVGAPRTGVSTAVTRCAAAWVADAERRGRRFVVIHVDRRTPLDSDAISDPGARICIVADDAHRIDDAGPLMSIAKGDHPHVTIIAGGRADAIRGAYGHWTREVAKARCGMVMTSRNDPDGDVLGVQVPRRALIPARAGLAWLVDAHPLRLAQIAIDANHTLSDTS
ncbi:MAG: FtsK/SpoIIIE domain-containing protein, partial [Ilumatobacter sp.]